MPTDALPENDPEDYECLRCGTIVSVEEIPLGCRECGGISFRNRGMPME